ncbi:MAG TPA: hypothetical protein VNL77_07180 [Roseiflexaceae bacterium]|nr:hypothetical protein [Roseiflexaceae bacterium]
MRKKRRSCLGTVGGAILIVLLLISVLGPPLYVEAEGLVAPGTVVGKREEITVRRSLWTRRLFLDVRYQPAGAAAPELTAIIVDPEHYDRTRVETPVAVRYLPYPEIRQLGAIAGTRLADQPPLGPLRAQLLGAQYTFLALGVGLALLAAWSVWRRGWLAVLFFVMLIGGALYVVSNPPPPAPPGPQHVTSATVRETHTIERVLGGRRSRGFNEAIQPYVIIELVFVPQGAADPVVAVDLVDEGSVPGLEKGADLPIRYSAADPRWARIEGAARTYAWKNLQGYGVIALVVLVLVVVLWRAHAARAARRSRQASG